jgi:hypothetical protein
VQSRDIGRTVPAVREAIRFSTLDLVGFFPWPISKKKNRGLRWNQMRACAR